MFWGIRGRWTGAIRKLYVVMEAGMGYSSDTLDERVSQAMLLGEAEIRRQQ